MMVKIKLYYHALMVRWNDWLYRHGLRSLEKQIEIGSKHWEAVIDYYHKAYLE